MLKAGSVFYAIAIALIIGIVTSSLIAYAYYNTLQTEYYLNWSKVEKNAYSALNLVLEAPEAHPFNEIVELDLYGNGNDSVTINKKDWGAYEMVVIKAHSGKQFKALIGMIGNGMYKNEKNGLYLADQDKPLSLCGETILQGISYLPKAGVKRAYVEGKSYTGEQLVYGVSKESKKDIPPFRKTLLEKIFSSLDNGKTLFSNEHSDSLSQIITSYDSIHNSFSNPPLFLQSPDLVDISNKSISGNVVIQSGRKIYVQKSAALKDIILLAPSIEFESGFQGSLQAFASDTLIIGEKVKLQYPSVAGVFRKEKRGSNSVLLMHEEATLQGTLMGYEEKEENGKGLRIQVDKDCKITGWIYCNGALDLKGKVYGSVFCKKFILITPSSVYENHLLNVEINPLKLSPRFTGINITDEATTGKRQVLKWLN